MVYADRLVENSNGRGQLDAMADDEMDEFCVSHRFFAFVEENFAAFQSEYCYAAEATGDETSPDRRYTTLMISRRL